MEHAKPIIGIVEDEKDLCSALLILFDRLCFPVSFVAHDGFEAEIKFQDANPKPDIIIMDNRLQTTRGTSTTRNILKMEPSTRFIFLSADMDAEKEAYDAGASIFLHKPVSFKIIKEAVCIVHSDGN